MSAFPLLAALAAAAQPGAAPPAVDPGRTARIFATIEHSEWCPAGHVALDLDSGRYALTRRAPRHVCNDEALERPERRGRLDGDALDKVAAAYRRLLEDGPEKPACLDGPGPHEIVISNGGTPILVLTTGAFTLSVPDDLTCWSEAAYGLRDALDRAFERPEPRGRD